MSRVYPPYGRAFTVKYHPSRVYYPYGRAFSVKCHPFPAQTAPCSVCNQCNRMEEEPLQLVVFYYAPGFLKSYFNLIVFYLLN